jgi:L-ribulose-5-phosphate 4-epimerase
VPVTRFLTKAEVARAYVENTGRVIAERFRKLDYHDVPGVLVAGHAPFTWGQDAAESVANSVALERIAEMAVFTMAVRRRPPLLPRHILEKHFRRKHGPRATYGQK